MVWDFVCFDVGGGHLVGFCGVFWLVLLFLLSAGKSCNLKAKN